MFLDEVPCRDLPVKLFQIRPLQRRHVAPARDAVLVGEFDHRLTSLLLAASLSDLVQTRAGPDEFLLPDELELPVEGLQQFRLRF